jgi:hypothetical protein
VGGIVLQTQRDLNASSQAMLGNVAHPAMRLRESICGSATA